MPLKIKKLKAALARAEDFPRIRNLQADTESEKSYENRTTALLDEHSME
jgi:hypothetical protein